jgi:ribosomal protein L11 methyltransferase
MPWLAVAFDTPEQWAEPYGELLSALGAVAVSELGRADVVLEPAPGATPRWPTTTIEALFALDAPIAEIARSLASFGRSHDAPIPHPDVRFVADQEFATAWRTHAVPRRFGEHLWVVPSECELPVPGAVALHMDPGLAFGTGEHPTTALCLEWLDGHTLRGAHVVDFGCGSGILAIAAALLGAERVIAIDHDPQALVATRNNARANEVERHISTASPDAMPDGIWRRQQVVIANILANPLIELAPQLSRLLASGGWLVMSGILEDQVARVRAAYPDVRFEEPVVADGWARVAGIFEHG